MPKLPLEGIRVVELTVAWTGPGVGQLLGDFGAEVIKIDFVDFWAVASRGGLARPSKEVIASQVPYTGGYPNREPGKYPWNVTPLWVGQARNKLGMTVKDLRKPKSRDIFLKLIEKCDVFVENNQLETLDKLVITYDVLKEINPGIIMARLPACGLTGPYATFRTHGMQIDALGGHISLRGYGDMGPDSTSDCPITDYTAPLFGVMGILLALLHRQKTGKGQLIECSSFETLPICLSEAMMDCIMNQRVQTRIGNRDIHGAAPCGCYRCQGKDEWINITVTSEEEWESFKKVLGNPSWAEEEQFSSAPNRWKNQDTLDKHIEKWTANQDKYDVMNMLQKEGVPAGPVMNSGDSYSDPHLKARGFFERVTHQDAGTHLYPGMAWKFSKTPLSIRRPSARFGGDNEYIYKHILGVSDAEYAELVQQGEISDAPAAHIP